MSPRTLRLQPWRYLHEVAHQLQVQGHNVTIISDGESQAAGAEILAGVPVMRCASVSNPRWRPNGELIATLRRRAPDVTLWHVGLTSFLYQQFLADLPGAAVGIFTSPLYRKREITRLGARRVLEGRALSATHVLGTFAPRVLVRAGLRQSSLRSIVVQTQVTQRRLVDLDQPADRVRIISPGVDPVWRPAPIDAETRAQLGFSSRDMVAMYFGSPARLRGLHSLIEAVVHARRSEPDLKLLVLSRRHADELLREDAGLRRLLASPELQPHVKVVSGYLDEEALVRHVAACDIVSLPFELIPSDAPLSLLEAQALGRPVVTTDLGCLPELVANGPHYLAQPADPRSLANALLAAARDLQKQHQKPLPPAPYEIRSWQEVGEEWSQLVQSL
jgi:glycosyltransferase involved in cell wall biosynthesis